MDIYGSGGGGDPDEECCFIDSHHHRLPPSNCDHHYHDNFFSHFPSLHSDEAAELEWLSQFVDDTTSFIPPDDDDIINIPNKNKNDNDNEIKESSMVSHYSQAASTSSSSTSTSGSVIKSRSKRSSELKGSGVAVRRCSHCASEKTPQWRTGPLGPKTLCNACGVRFKSGRLVPEYRPAASPTFVLTQHSNSHRKVMELRRQKELLRQQQQQHHDFKVC